MTGRPAARLAPLALAAAAAAAPSALAQSYSFHPMPGSTDNSPRFLRNDATAIMNISTGVAVASASSTAEPDGSLSTVASDQSTQWNSINNSLLGASRSGHIAIMRTVEEITWHPPSPFPTYTLQNLQLEIGPATDRLVALTMDGQVPGFPTGTTWAAAEFYGNAPPDVLINPTGLATFRAPALDAVFRILPPILGGAPVVTLVARAGAQAPGVTWSDIHVDAINSSGAVLLRHNTSNILSSGWALRSVPVTGPATLIAATGAAAPGGGQFTAEAPPIPASFNNAGHAVFAAAAAGAGPILDGIGLYRYTPGAGLVAIMRRNQPAPGTGGGTVLQTPVFATLNQPRPIIGPDGAVAFPALLSGPNVTAENDVAIYYRGPGDTDPLIKLAREGDPAPGTRWTFGPLADWGESALTIDAAGGVYFTGVVIMDNNQSGSGIWYRPADGGPVRKILVSGDTITDEGQQRTVLGVVRYLPSTGPQDGRGTWVNDFGQVLMNVTLDNQTRTLVLATPTLCPADWNTDGAVNSSDIAAFLTTWLSSISNATLTADFNADTQVNSADISAFLSAWLNAVQNGC